MAVVRSTARTVSVPGLPLEKSVLSGFPFFAVAKSAGLEFVVIEVRQSRTFMLRCTPF